MLLSLVGEGIVVDVGDGGGEGDGKRGHGFVLQNINLDRGLGFGNLHRTSSRRTFAPLSAISDSDSLM